MTMNVWMRRVKLIGLSRLPTEKVRRLFLPGPVWKTSHKAEYACIRRHSPAEALPLVGLHLKPFGLAVHTTTSTIEPNSCRSSHKPIRQACTALASFSHTVISAKRQGLPIHEHSGSGSLGFHNSCRPTLACLGLPRRTFDDTFKLFPCATRARVGGGPISPNRHVPGIRSHKRQKKKIVALCWETR